MGGKTFARNSQISPGFKRLCVDPHNEGTFYIANGAGLLQQHFIFASACLNPQVSVLGGYRYAGRRAYHILMTGRGSVNVLMDKSVVVAFVWSPSNSMKSYWTDNWGETWNVVEGLTGKDNYISRSRLLPK